MIEGALIALAGVLVGRILPGRRKKTPKAVCGCRHTIGFHEGMVGECSFTEQRHLGYRNGQSNYGQVRCTCKHYDGPKSIETFFAPPMLPPSAS